MTTYIYKVTIATTTPRPHYALFIEANSNGSGYLIHVIGDVQTGYDLDIYGGEIDNGIKAEHLHGYADKELIGSVEEGRLTEIVDACEAVKPPGVQMNEYGVKIKKDVPFYRDGEWMADVVRKLVDLGLLTLI